MDLDSSFFFFFFFSHTLHAHQLYHSHTFSRFLESHVMNIVVFTTTTTTIIIIIIVVVVVVMTNIMHLLIRMICFAGDDGGSQGRRGPPPARLRPRFPVQDGLRERRGLAPQQLLPGQRRCRRGSGGGGARNATHGPQGSQSDANHTTFERALDLSFRRNLVLETGSSAPPARLFLLSPISFLPSLSLSLVLIIECWII